MKVSPLHDWMLVKMDPLNDQYRGIHLAGRGRIRTGEVLRVGPGHKKGALTVPLDVRVGERVSFFRENLEHKQGRQLQSVLHEMGEDLALIRSNDVLFVIEAGDPELSA